VGTRFAVLAVTAASALILGACGTESVEVDDADANASAGAEIFAANCSGCHTMTPAGTNGSGNRALRAQGPNFDQRLIGYDEALYAIRNGGFSGAIMPQNIVVGEEAALVAEFIEKYSGTEAQDSPRPSPEPGTESEGSAQDTVEAEGLEGPEGEESTADVDGADAARPEGRGTESGGGSGPGDQGSGGGSSSGGQGSGSGGNDN